MTLKARLRRLAVRGSRAWYRFRGPSQPGPPQTPKVPAGWRVGPPHYVGVGAQKAGTSWWNRLIEAHPDVVSAGGLKKELHYFDRSWETPFDDEQARRYQRYFPVPEGKVAGEWTPGYLIDFWTPELIARAAPDARILILLRDPIERFRSGLTHQLATSRKPIGHRDIQGAFQRGLYAPQLRRVLAAFPPALALAMFIMSPGHLNVMVEDPLGIRMIVGAVAMQIIGTLLIRKLVNIEY